MKSHVIFHMNKQNYIIV